MERFAVTDYSDNPHTDRPSGRSGQISPSFYPHHPTRLAACLQIIAIIRIERTSRGSGRLCPSSHVAGWFCSLSIIAIIRARRLPPAPFPHHPTRPMVGDGRRSRLRAPDYRAQFACIIDRHRPMQTLRRVARRGADRRRGRRAASTRDRRCRSDARSPPPSDHQRNVDGDHDHRVRAGRRAAEDH